jgi:hypothetical protein
MAGRELWRVVRGVLIVAVLIAASTGTAALLPGVDTPTVQADVAADKRDDKDEKKRKQQHHDDDRGDDFVLNGQVLEVREEKDPPELIVGTVDGRALIRVIKTDEITRNGVGVGDFVELTGEKINELLFEATEISVHHRAERSDDDDDDEGDDDDESEDEGSD